jgi:protease I
MSKRVLILTGDAVEVLEVYYPYYRLLEEGFDAVIAAPAAKTLHTVCHDFVEGWATYSEKPAHLLQAHVAFADVDPAQYDALVIPGGRAPEYIRNHPELPRIIGHFIESDKPIGAICHGPLAFLALRDRSYFQGKTMSAYSACRLDIESLGARYAEGTVHVDGKLVTGHAWPDLPGFMRELIKLLR